MHQAIFAGEHFHKRPEFLGRDDAALVGLSDLDFAGHVVNDFLCASHAFAAGGVDVHRAVVLDINLRAAFGDDALDGFAAGADERADLFGINFNGLNARRVRRELRPRFIQHAAHDLEDFAACLRGARDRFGHDFVADAGQLQIQLETGHTSFGAAEFEVHVAKMVFRTDDVGEQFIALELAVFAVIGDQAYRDAGDGRFDGHAGVHQRQCTRAHAGHGSRSVRFHNLAGDANRVAKVFFARYHGFKRAFGERAMADLASPGCAGSSGFSDAEGRKVVMQNKTLRLFSAAVRIEHLRFFRRRQCGQGQRLRFAPLEQGRTMGARQHADFATNGTQIFVAAAVNAFAFFQNALAECALLNVIERLRNGERICLGIFFQDCGLHLGFEGIDRLGAGGFALGVQGAFDPVARHTIGNLEQIGVHLQQLNLPLRLVHNRSEFFLNANHFTGVPVCEFEGAHKFVFWQFPGRTFDHDHVVFRAHVNEVKIALGALCVSRVGDKLAIHAADADRANRAGKWNVRDAQRSRRPVDCQNVRIVLAVGAQKDGNDLGVIKIASRK